MSNIGPQQQNATYNGILQVPGGVTAQLQQVQDGNGNGTGLFISSSGVNVTTSDSFVPSIAGTSMAGANARLISDGLGDVISVKDFGAVGDGVTDDTVALQNAINAACLSGSPLLLGEKNEVYLITSGLIAKPQTDIPNQSGSIHFYNTVPFVLIGKGNACIKAGAAMTNMLTIIYNAAYSEIAPFYSKIEGVFFNANNLATTAIQSNYAMHVTFVRNRIQNATNGIEYIGYGVANIRDNVFLCNNGIWFHDGGGDSVMNHNDFYFTQTGSSGILFNGWSGNSDISANIFSIEAITGACYAIKADNTNYSTHEIRNLRIISNEFFGCIGFYAQGYSTSNRNVADCTIAFNHTLYNGTTGTYGILVDATYCTSLDISNNFGNGAIYGTSNAVPITLTNCSYSKITNNALAQLQNQAIILSNCSNSQVNGNKFIDFGKGSTAYHAVELSGTTSNTQILNNQAVQTSGSYGVNFVVESGSADYTYYSDNTCSSTITNPVVFVGSNSVNATNYFETTATYTNISPSVNGNLYINLGSSGTSGAFAYVANASNYLIFVPATAGNSWATVQAGGSDTDVDVRILSKNAGTVWLGTPNEAATTPSSFAASRYLRLKDENGAVVYVPCSNSPW
jgi:hypothetical protein